MKLVLPVRSGESMMISNPWSFVLQTHQSCQEMRLGVVSLNNIGPFESHETAQVKHDTEIPYVFLWNHMKRNIPFPQGCIKKLGGGGRPLKRSNTYLNTGNTGSGKTQSLGR